MTETYNDIEINLEDLDKKIDEVVSRVSKIDLALAQKYLDVASRKKDFFRMARAWELKGLLRYFDKQHEAAISDMKKVLHIARKHFPDDRLVPVHYSRIGLCYAKQENFELAINYCMKVLAFKDYDNISNTYSHIASCYERMKDFDNALKYHDIGLSIAKKRKRHYDIVLLSYNTAHTNYVAGNVEVAHKQVKGVLELLESDNDFENPHQKVMLSIHAQSLYSWTLIRVNKKKEGVKKLEEAIKLCEQKALYMLYTTNMHEKAELCFETGREDEAILCLKKVLEYVKANDLRHEEKKTLQKLIDYYQSKKDFEPSFLYLNQLQDLSQLQFKESREKNLQKIIADREQEIQTLEEKNREIEEQNTILKQFAHIISHDLREPIRGITGFAGMLNNKYSENLDKTANEYVQFILSEAHSMNRNLARLLEYATIEKSADKIKEIDLQQIITQIQQQYQDESFQLNVTYEGIPIKMQRQHTNVLLGELIDNAVQFRKKDENCRIEIKCESKAGHYDLSVKDYGIGIDATYHDKIFKIFNKINKWEGTGAGVGLAICERIAHLYKGKIQVESVPDVSTTVHVMIPR